MWPYSAGTDLLLPGGLLVKPHTGCQRVAFTPYQPLAVTAADQAPTAADHTPSGTSLSPSSQSSQRQPPHSALPSQMQLPQPTVNTSSSPAVFYVPYVSQVQSSIAHQSSLTPVQNVRHQAQSSKFLTEPRPVVLFPVCYVQHTSNIHPVRHAFSPNNPQQNVQCPSQSAGMHGQNVTDMKSHGSVASSYLLSPQYVPSFPTVAYTQSGENPHVTTGSPSLYSYNTVIVGNPASTCQTSHKSQFTSPPSQPSVCVQQSVMQMQTTHVTLPPVYVSITSSTQSPATRTHAGGHVAAQFSSLRSQSLPVSSSSPSGALNHPLNSGTPFLGYTVCTPPVQGIPPQSSLAAVTVNQNTHAAAQPSQFSPAYVSAFQVLQPNVPLVANIGSSSSQSVMCSQFPTPISTVSKVPLSFPFVKQASDPGIGEHLAVSNAVPKIFEWIRFRGTSYLNDLCLIGPPMQQHLGPLLLPQLPSIARFPRASISHHSPANRPPKTRKQRSKGSSSSSTTHVSQSVFEVGGNRVLEVEGLPGDMRKYDVERYLEEVAENGAKIYFVNSESLEILEEGSDLLASSKYIVLAVFDSDTAAQNALLSIKTSKFQLRRWHRSQDCGKMKKS
ncbi:uncharacterized protein LOC118205061 [Stegodyphus dumicola]|uniref:uncharacterized protein LOC118205061 n=1 Tax=Stegodyphus dumicola TaxID=202533 RepID=UPI0015AB163A|nr:uncharacterized protein LOC118205061 [Stegodyphus dumicola]